MAATRCLAVVVLFLGPACAPRVRPPLPPPTPGPPRAIVTRSAEVQRLPAGERVRDRSLGRHLEYVPIESRALAGNLVGDPSTREYAVLLPPAYFDEPERRWNTAYLLHGLGSRQDGHLDLVPTMLAMFERMKEGRLAPMLLVAVDGSTLFGGSYYANSPTIGNFEAYVAEELVAAVDARFRTRAERKGRGIGGFSMGGHGALKLAMKYGDTFALAGSLSGSPMSIRYRKHIYKAAIVQHTPPASLEELVRDVRYDTSWNLAAAYAKAAAFLPNPDNPPFFLALPFTRAIGPDDDDETWQRWWDDDPHSLVVKYQRNLRRLALLYVDHGDNETALGTEDFDRELVRYGISHAHWIFRGDHSEQLENRFLRLLRRFADAWIE